MNRYLGLNLSLNEYKNITNNDLSSLWENSMSYCDSNKLSKLMLDSSAVQNMNIFDRFFDERYDNLDICSKLLMADSRTYLPDYILTKVDRCSMSVSLEAREPFLDHRLIEFTTALPTEYKIRGTTSKYILRKILRKYIPESLIIKKKKGFGMPITKWLKTGDFKPTVNEYLNPERLRTDGIFNPVEIQKLLSLFYRGKNEMGQAIWNLLMFQMWKERWF